MASKIRCITCLEELRDKVTKAVESVAVFATEWGTCDASGDGTLNFEETKTWLLGLLWHAVAICSLGFGTVWVIIDTCWEMLSIPTWCNTLRSPCFLRHDETCLRLDFFERLNISDANWAVSDKQEACSALLPGASGEGGWKDCDLEWIFMLKRINSSAEVR